MKKLLKYELTFMAKFLMIYYIITLLLAALTRLFFAVATTTFLDIVAKIFQGAFISVAITTFINVLMRYWSRFRNNFYGDEAYLTHTLPVKKGTLYASKVLGGVITMFVTLLFIIACVFLAYGTPENFEWIRNTFTSLETAFNSSLGAFVAFVCVAFVVQSLTLMTSGFLGLVIGHRFLRSKIGFSVLFGAVAYTLAQLLLLVVVLIIGAFNGEIMTMLTSNQGATIDALTTILIAGSITYFLACIGIYWLGDYFFKKGVNVD
ncbi:MAG: hypothetical protein IKC37_00935 [Clostridia bacterium]|nr:hypothetical protein [Clostridia bacterium]